MDFQVLHLICSILPFTAVAPVMRVIFAPMFPHRVTSWPRMIWVNGVGIPGLIFLPGLVDDTGQKIAESLSGDPSLIVGEALTVGGALVAQKSILSWQSRASAEVASVGEVVEAQPAKRRGLSDPEGEAELAERHDAVLRAWLAADMAGDERMLELVESASELSRTPGAPEYRRAVELLEDHWADDLDNRIGEATLGSASELSEAPGTPGHGTFGQGWYDVGDPHTPKMCVRPDHEHPTDDARRRCAITRDVAAYHRMRNEDG